MRAETNNVIYSQLMFSCLIDYFGQKMVKKKCRSVSSFRGKKPEIINS